MSQVIIGMDPHKRSATIEVMTSEETVVGGGRYGTDVAGYRAMLAEARQWPERTWAIEGCQGIGRRIANRLPVRGRTCGGCAAQAAGPHPGVRHRARPEHRCRRGASGWRGPPPG